jgi:histidinol-phosphate aminotransferase
MQKSGLSRRQFAGLLGAGAAGAALPSFPVGLAAAPAAMGPVLLNSNENPLGPSAGAVKAMREALTEVYRYPDRAEDELGAAIAHMHGVSEDELLLGNGSSDILRLAAGAFGAKGQTVVLADPSFEIIGFHGMRFGAEVVKVPLTPTYAHDVERIAAAAKGAGLIYVCNPNNPTATITPKAAVRWLLENVPETTTVVVDEAYHHYAMSSDYESVLPLVKSKPNLIVARTFSKVYALAGARVGYAIAQKAMIETLRGQQAFNVPNLLGVLAARAALLDEGHVAAARRHNSALRTQLAKDMSTLGYAVLPSEANFAMIELRREVRPVIAAFRERNIRVGRPFPAMPQNLRVTIGLGEEMARFTEAFRAIMT